MRGRMDGMHRPSCIAPLKVNGKYITDAQEKAEVLAIHFAGKLADRGEITTTTKENGVRIGIRTKFKGGRIKLDPPITEKEVYLAVQDIPGSKATGPDKLPAEVYKNLLGLHRIMAKIYTYVMEANYIPPGLCGYLIIPLDKMSKDQFLIK